jgi:hypothetical protein
MKATENFISRNTQQNESNNELHFEINSLQCLYENNEEYFNKPLRKNNFEIIWVIKGKGHHYLDMQESGIEDNNIFFYQTRTDPSASVN